MITVVDSARGLIESHEQRFARLLEERVDPADIPERIKALSEAGRMKIRDLANVDDARLVERYRRAAGRIYNRILAHGDETGRLTTMLNDIDGDIRRLSDNVTKRMQATIGRSFDMSLINLVATMRLYAPYFPNTFSTEITPKAFQRIHSRAVRALSVGPDGVELSARIWNTHQITLQRMRQFIVNSYLRGDTGSQIAAGARKFLLFPDVDLRTKKWRAFFAENPPGRGVYRSAYKNVQRVMRTEINAAYRLATAEYAAERSWVEGVQWNLVPAHSCCDDCDDIAETDMFGLGDGVYPPDAVPVTPHPQCLCFTSIVVRPEILQAAGLPKTSVADQIAL